MEKILKNIRRTIRSIIRLAILAGLGFAAWKLVRHWHSGLAEKTGHNLDASIKATAERLEKTATKLEKWAENHQTETMGKGLDGVVMDTKKTLDKATDLVHHAFNHVN